MGWPNCIRMSGSVNRPLRMGSMREASWHWYTAMNLVMPASTGSSYTMSAQDSPVWGRAAGRFSTFTARARRSGTELFGASPVRGHTGGGGDDEAPGEDPPSLPLATGTPALPPRNSTAPATPPATTSVTTIEATMPRRVKAIVRGLLAWRVRG